MSALNSLRELLVDEIRNLCEAFGAAQALLEEGDFSGPATVVNLTRPEAAGLVKHPSGHWIHHAG